MTWQRGVEPFLAALQRYPERRASISFARWDLDHIDLSPSAVARYAERAWKKAGEKPWWCSHDPNIKGFRGRYLVVAGIDFHGTNFRGSDLTAVRFDECNLSGCDFSGADLSYAILDEANADGARFVGARVYCTSVDHLKATDADFTGVDIRYLVMNPKWGREYRPDSDSDETTDAIRSLRRSGAILDSWQ
jgi:uncharacterized protein YjbI with pentapeptide repeats